MKQFDMSDDRSSHQYGGMTHYVDLPTKGTFYPENHPLHGVESLEVKMLTTKEEDILTNTSYIEKNIMLDKLIEAIIFVDVKAKEMHEADQLAILIASRIEAYGADYPISLLCKSCLGEYVYEFDLLTIEPAEKTSKYERTAAGTFIVELPKSEKAVEFKHLTPKEIGSIEASVEKMKKLNINTSFNNEFYKRVVLSVDGSADKDEVGALIESLRIMDSRKLFSTYKETLPNLDTSYTSVCPHCQHSNEGGLPIQANFFFPEL